MFYLDYDNAGPFRVSLRVHSKPETEVYHRDNFPSEIDHPLHIIRSLWHRGDSHHADNLLNRENADPVFFLVHREGKVFSLHQVGIPFSDLITRQVLDHGLASYFLRCLNPSSQKYFTARLITFACCVIVLSWPEGLVACKRPYSFYECKASWCLNRHCLKGA